jgi:heat shock protein HslJ
MKKIIVFLSILSAIIISSCSSGKEEVDIRLHDIWALESIGGEKIISGDTLKNFPILEIYAAEKRVHGNTGCNTLNGSVNIDGDNIAFEKITTTEIACPGNLEQKFLAALSKVNKYKIEKMRLYLYKDEKELLVFQKID